MKTIRLNRNIIDLNNRPIGLMAHILALGLVSVSTGDAVKLYDWALKLRKDGELQLGDEDLDEIRSIVFNHTTMTVLSKAQILNAINEPEAQNPA